MSDMRIEFETTLETSENDEVAVRVVAEYTPPDPGNLCGPPDRCWPSEPAQAELLSVIRIADGHDVTLTKDDYTALYDEALNVAEAEIESAQLERKLAALDI